VVQAQVLMAVEVEVLEPLVQMLAQIRVTVEMVKRP
jgi:hypothetical protein